MAMWPMLPAQGIVPPKTIDKLIACKNATEPVMPPGWDISQPRPEPKSATITLSEGELIPLLYACRGGRSIENNGWRSKLMRGLLDRYLRDPSPMDRSAPPPGWHDEDSDDEDPAAHGIARCEYEPTTLSDAWATYDMEHQPLTDENAVLRDLVVRAYRHYDNCLERDEDGFQEWIADSYLFFRQVVEDDETSAPPPISLTKVEGADGKRYEVPGPVAEKMKKLTELAERIAKAAGVTP